MFKLIISTIIVALSIVSLGYAFETSSDIRVNNAIVPLNNNFADQLDASIGISNTGQTVSSGDTVSLNVQPGDQGAIVVTAPFCGQYIGFECFVPIPNACINQVGKSGQLTISGVISSYGLDLRSLRCFYRSDEVETSSMPSSKSASFCH